MNKQNQYGSVHIVVVSLIIVVLLGALGFLFWQNFAKKSPVKTTSTVSGTSGMSPAQNTPTPQPSKTKDQATLQIPELGIKLINIPTGIRDLNYVVDATHNDPAGQTSVWFSTVTLSDKDKSCSPDNGSLGIIAKIAGSYNDHPRVGFVKQYDGFWIDHVTPQSPCSENKDAQNLTMSQLQLFNRFLSDPGNIQLLGN